MALLQGLFDTNGRCNKNGKQEFCSSNKLLAAQTLELIKSLGIKAKMVKITQFCMGKLLIKYIVYI